MDTKKAESVGQNAVKKKNEPYTSGSDEGLLHEIIVG